MMKNHAVADDFGRRTTFSGEKMVEESTDNYVAASVTLQDVREALSSSRNPAETLRDLGVKPQWLEITVWRTQGGSFVVKRATHYRVRHARENCIRANGYEMVEATETDTYPCLFCNQSNAPGGFAQESRVSVDVYHTPEEIISSFQVGGKYSNPARTVLADLSEQDARVDEAWNTVRVQ